MSDRVSGEQVPYRRGRTSCWVLGGLGCLGLLILAFVGIYLLGRAIQQSFGGVIQQSEQMERMVIPRMKSIYQALQRYAADHNGKYPPNLQALAPRYLDQSYLQPIAVQGQKTPIKIIYKPPKPDAPPDTIVLEHQPPIVMKFGMFGESVETRITLQVQKDGQISQMQETLSSSGGRRVRQRVRPAGP